MLNTEEQASADRAMAALDSMADKWLETDGLGLKESLAEIASRIPGPFKERSFEMLTRIVKHAHACGLYEGMHTGREMGKLATGEKA